jgi:hypothetical protein
VRLDWALPGWLRCDLSRRRRHRARYGSISTMSAAADSGRRGSRAPRREQSCRVARRPLSSTSGRRSGGRPVWRQPLADLTVTLSAAGAERTTGSAGSVSGPELDTSPDDIGAVSR